MAPGGRDSSDQRHDRQFDDPAGTGPVGLRAGAKAIPGPANGLEKLLAEPAIEGVARLPSSDAQQGLLILALTEGRPVPLRIKSADAAIRHVQINGKLTTQTLIDSLIAQPRPVPEAELRAKLMVLRGLLAPDAKAYVGELRNHSPPLVPPPPAPVPEPKPKN